MWEIFAGLSREKWEKDEDDNKFLHRFFQTAQASNRTGTQNLSGLVPSIEIFLTRSEC
jgi:hypothetical protein